MMAPGPKALASPQRWELQCLGCECRASLEPGSGAWVHLEQPGPWGLGYTQQGAGKLAILGPGQHHSSISLHGGALCQQWLLATLMAKPPMPSEEKATGVYAK